jgi:hypothetical protein
MIKFLYALLILIKKRKDFLIPLIIIIIIFILINYFLSNEGFQPFGYKIL